MLSRLSSCPDILKPRVPAEANRESFYFLQRADIRTLEVPNARKRPSGAIKQVQFQFDEKVDKTIEKSVKSAQRFYKELNRASLEKGEQRGPPSYEDFASMAKGLMEADKLVQMDKLRAQNLRDVLEHTWSQKLQNYSTRKLLREAHEALVRRL